MFYHSLDLRIHCANREHRKEQGRLAAVRIKKMQEKREKTTRK